MCGITGIINFDETGICPDILKKMTDAIAHRGPDDEGRFIDGNIGIGHRRLSILDLSSAGGQPMRTSDGNHIISYNGEVYNFKELRQELENKGYRFKSRTDTEVVLNSYVEWGIGCLDKFNGMFAFVIWDKRKKELFIARDRYGIKPLYYTVCNNKLIFGSEIKAILQHSDYSMEINLDGLLEYFTFQNFFTDKTLFKGVNIFPAGHYALVSSSNFNPVQYWDFNFHETEEGKTEEEYVEELDYLLKQAVNRQLVSDVELGSYLSGGIDSGSISAIAAKKIPYIKTFTCGFDLSSASGLELSFDERSKAEHMSYLFKTEHYEMVLKSGDMERCLPHMARCLEEPRIGQSYPNHYTARLASKFVKVVLGGWGGDELFAGYPWRYYRAAVNDNFEHYIDNYYKYWQRLIPNTLIKKVFGPVFDDVKHVWTRDIFQDVFKNYSPKLNSAEDYINNSLYFEAKTFLHSSLVVEDKLAMAQGLELRVPFLDNDLVDLAMRMPLKFKLKNLKEVSRLNENEIGPKNEKFFKKTHDGKLMLRKVIGKYVPNSISNGLKQGFSAPDASWFRGESIECVKNRLLNSKAEIYNYLDCETVKSLIGEHLDGRKNRRLLIWSLLNFENWCEQFLA